MSETIRATRPEPPPHVSAEIEVAHTPIPKWAIGEFFGTFLARLFGCGSVCAAVATGAQVGVFQSRNRLGNRDCDGDLSDWFAEQRAPESRRHDRLQPPGRAFPLGWWCLTSWCR